MAIVHLHVVMWVMRHAGWVSTCQSAQLDKQRRLHNMNVEHHADLRYDTPTFSLQMTSHFQNIEYHADLKYDKPTFILQMTFHCQNVEHHADLRYDKPTVSLQMT